MEVIVRIVERIPRLLRPALLGAALLFAIVSIRMVFAIPRLMQHPVELRSLLLALGAASSTGAVGGLAYSLVGAPLRSVRGIGPYLTGIVTVSAYMGALVIAAPYAFGETLIERRSDLIVFVVVMAFFGMVMGHSWFREK